MIRKATAFLMPAVVLFVLAGTPSLATVHQVNVGGFAFSPAILSISQGDIVRWVWVDGLHTTTSGDPIACTADLIWDAPIDPTHTSFEFTFNQSGTFDYFCRNHCLMGMAGTVNVAGNPGGIPGGAGARNAILSDLTAAPNPAESGTVVRFDLARPERVRLEVLDVTGRRVTTLADGLFAGGAQGVAWDGRTETGAPAPSGVYLARSHAAGATATTLIVLLR